MLICQDNMIEHVSGLEFLSHLQQLALANNPLTDFKELRRLSHLPDLTELSLKDLNFGVGARTMDLCESECVSRWSRRMRWCVGGGSHQVISTSMGYGWLWLGAYAHE